MQRPYARGGPRQRPYRAAHDLESGTNRERLPKTLDVDRIDHLFTEPVRTAVEQRDHARAKPFYSSGLHLAELAAIGIRESISSAAS